MDKKTVRSILNKLITMWTNHKQNRITNAVGARSKQNTQYEQDLNHITIRAKSKQYNQ